MFQKLYAEMARDAKARDAAARELQDVPSTVELTKVRAMGARWSPAMQRLADTLNGIEHDDFSECILA